LSGDVDNDDTHHASRTHEIVNTQFTGHSYWNITPHRYYRIVLGVVGRRLEEFDRTWEAVNAMHAALKGQMTVFLAVSLHNSLTYIIAHEKAHEAGILHQDISLGNILIVSSGELADRDDQFKPEIEGGMLIDWDLSKIVDPKDGGSTACWYARTVS